MATSAAPGFIHASKISDIALLEALAAHEARDSFAAYRRFLWPHLKESWFQDDMAARLQRFFHQLDAGERPKLVIEAPPQHGKTSTIVEFVTWVLGKRPDLKTFYSSFSERLGVRANIFIQRTMLSPRYAMVFPEVKIGSEIGGVAAVRNREMIEIEGRRGYFRNTTVQGPINGEGLDLGILDDPIKGREAASSPTTRDKTWLWFTDDFLSRFSDQAGLLAILTRWHIDDPIGRLKEAMAGKIECVSYPAIAVVDDGHRKAGEALFPEHKSLEFLLERKSVMASVNWEALYQQNPQVVGGELIHGSSFPRYQQLPGRLDYRIMVVDTAIKADTHNDWTVAQVWGKSGGKIYLIDQWRAKIEAADLRTSLLTFWAKHAAMNKDDFGQLRALEIEDKASGSQVIQEIKRMGGIPVKAIPRSKDKFSRWCDVAGYIEAGCVHLPENAPFTHDLVAELESFTADNSHIHDDQVDVLIGACESMLTEGTSVVSLWEKMT
jgi:predicted phage terminase large subunit-like protein